MKNRTNLYSGLGICAVVVLGVWWYNAPKGAKLSLPNVAAGWVHAVNGPTKQPVKWETTVPATRVATYTYEFYKPAHFYGSWSSLGATAGIKGAADDCLVSCELRGPDDKVLQKWGHANGGNFEVTVPAPGRYTFVLNNSGLVRNSARKVSIDAVAESQ
jgi:hypothetical protein